MIDKKKIIVKISMFIGLITILTLMLLLNINLGITKTLSIESINKAKQSLEILKNNYNKEEQLRIAQKTDKRDAKEAFASAKNEYEAISEETIKIVQEATKEQKYLIEFLWVEIGDYAENNNLRLIVLEPNTKSTFTIKTSASKVDIVADTSKSNTSSSGSGSSTETSKTNKISINTDKSTVKILVVGTYQNIADFVFEVENDKDLRFKLDNITMTYAENNFVVATFDVLDMSVLMK